MTALLFFAAILMLPALQVGPGLGDPGAGSRR
jgi:hypothetical protein